MRICITCKAAETYSPVCSYCLVCRRAMAKKWRDSNRAKVLEYEREYRAKHKTAVSARQRKRQYSLTTEEQNKLLARYNGACWICRSISDRMHIDHDHSCCKGARSCGKCVRGVLCQGCNHGLGGFRDDPAKLAAAIEYINSCRRPEDIK